ncbi:MAG: dTDP-4-dehydrorhamnose 3,5-epimerase [Paenibacillaceae bacterium]
MNVMQTKLSDVYIIEPTTYMDARGFFMESYNRQTFIQHGINESFIQDNHSLSLEVGTIRGLHYQLNPSAQTKLVSVVSGAIYDIVVDIRQSSPTFGHWIGELLSGDNKRQLFIPKGFAHGFCTLMPNTQVFYKVDQFYSPECDRGILWNDPALGIDWPTEQPILSDKDQRQPLLKDADLNFE